MIGSAWKQPWSKQQNVLVVGKRGVCPYFHFALNFVCSVSCSWSRVTCRCPVLRLLKSTNFRISHLSYNVDLLFLLFPRKTKPAKHIFTSLAVNVLFTDETTQNGHSFIHSFIHSFFQFFSCFSFCDLNKTLTRNAVSLCDSFRGVSFFFLLIF